jgi:hypothetical protein
MAEIPKSLASDDGDEATIVPSKEGKWQVRVERANGQPRRVLYSNAFPPTQHSTKWQNFWVFQQPISLSIMLRVPLVIFVLLTLQHLSLLHLDRLPRTRGHSTRLNLRHQRVKQLAVLGVRNPFSKIRNVLEFNGNSCNVLDGSPIIIIIESAFLMKTILALQLPEDSNKQTQAQRRFHYGSRNEAWIRTRTSDGDRSK